LAARSFDHAGTARHVQIGDGGDGRRNQSNEPDTLNYEWFISEDQQTCHIYERYVDSAATMIHLATFGEKFAERILATVEPTRFVVYGNPDETVRGALAGFGAVHMEEIGGFAR